MKTLEQIQNSAIKDMVVSVVDSTKKTGARFASLTYTNESGETSLYNIILGVQLEPLYKSDLFTLKKIRKSLTGVSLTACDELIASISESLRVGIGNNSAYTLKGYYDSITPNGEVKLHKDEKGQTHLYIRGYMHKKTVLTKGTYKHVNSNEKTLAKKELEKTLKRGRIRTFKINVNVLKTVKMNGMTIEIGS